MKSSSLRDIETRVGRLDQVAGVRRLAYIEGPEAGVEQIHVRTGAGLEYAITPQRGMDIAMCSFRGAAISWLSASGSAHPSLANLQGNGWLRTAAGGLLMTCGFRQVGSPGEDDGEELGLHGRAHHIPAEQVCTRTLQHDGAVTFEVSGLLREARLFGENIHVRRTVTSRLGENHLQISDHIRNAAFRTTPFMLLYHFNFGWPLLSEKARIQFPSRKVEPREAGTPLAGYDRFDPPTPGMTERVYFHKDLQTQDGMAEAVIEQPDFAGLGLVRLRLRWAVESLPHLVQWKMPGCGEYVLGIEPANCLVLGRKAERQAGRLKFLEPGQEVTTRLELLVDDQRSAL